METTKKKISFQDNSEVEILIRVVREGDMANSIRERLTDFIEDQIINDENIVETEEDDLEEDDLPPDTFDDEMLEEEAFEDDLLDDDDWDDDFGQASGIDDWD